MAIGKFLITTGCRPSSRRPRSSGSRFRRGPPAATRRTSRSAVRLPNAPPCSCCLGYRPLPRALLANSSAAAPSPTSRPSPVTPVRRACPRRLAFPCAARPRRPVLF
ncbi:hypothetical protein BS78_04G041000 [Paspalum vaginatum]|nr:hypothetical protein BS78_04G041000 [Paspalum vaginatum]